MKTKSYNVSTKVLLAQARATLRLLTVPGTQARRQALAGVGIDCGAFAQNLEVATVSLEGVEAEQERAKTAYLREAREDRAIAEEGYRYKLELEARTRAYIAINGDEHELPSRLRFGHLRAPRARGVIYELRIALLELEGLEGRLASVGVNDAFMQRGHDILARLHADQAETAEAKKQRMQLTKQVREGELQVSRLLAQLRAADEALAIAIPNEASVFRLDIIAAEMARVRAARESRVAAAAVPVDDED